MTRNPHPRSSIPELTAGCSPAPIPSPTILRSKQITPPRYCSLPSGFSSTEDATQLWRVICSFTETAAIRAFGVCPESKEKASSFPYGNSAPSRLREGPATKTRPSCRRDRMVIGKKKKTLFFFFFFLLSLSGQPFMRNLFDLAHDYRTVTWAP